MHYQLRRNKTDPNGKHAWGLGIRIGYWPCLHAPFIQAVLGTRNLSVWYGLPSYTGLEEK